MIRLRRSMERTLRHPLLGPLVAVLIAVVLVFLLLHGPVELAVSAAIAFCGLVAALTAVGLLLVLIGGTWAAPTPVVRMLPPRVRVGLVSPVLAVRFSPLRL